jgi:ribonuclease Z
MLALEDAGRSILIDCGGDLFQRALLAGLDPDGIDGLIITHEHPDHVGGFALFMLRIWQAGRSRPLPVYGIERALHQARRLLGSFATDGWTLPEIQWVEIESAEAASVLTSDQWSITATPGIHSVPVVGLRCQHVDSGFVITYSCDTEPCPAIDSLAKGADFLVHEATGEGRGHTSAAQAVDVAKRAGCPQLVLVHLPRGLDREDIGRLETSGVQVVMGEELDRFEF